MSKPTFHINFVRSIQSFSKRYLVPSVLILSLGIVGPLATSTPTSAAINYYLPYPSGESYNVSQGPGGEYSHTGNSAQAIDFELTSDDDIAASAPGTLFRKESNHADFGRMVFIKHSDGYCTIYAHMSSFSSAVNGMTENVSSVSQGQILGKAGDTGFATGVHLHFGRANCSTSVTVDVDFVEVADPAVGSSYTSQNASGGGGTTVPGNGSITGDGAADLVGISKAGDGTPRVNVFASNGSDDFAAPQLWAHPTSGWEDWVNKRWLSGDVDNDDDADLIGISKGGDGTPYIHVFKSNGSGFANPQQWAHPTSGWSEWDTKRWLTADVNNDGKWDLIAISRGGDGTPYVHVFKSNGTSFTAPTVWAHPTSGWNEWDTKVWLAADVGTDGKADLVGITKAGDGTPYIYVFASNGTSFNSPTLWAHPTSGWNEWATKRWLVGKVTNDAKADLIGISKATNGTPYVHVFVSNGSNGFAAPQVWAHPTDGWNDWDNKVWLTASVGSDAKADLIGISKGGDGTPWIHVFASRGNDFAEPSLWAHPTSGWEDWDNKVWLAR